MRWLNECWVESVGLLVQHQVKWSGVRQPDVMQMLLNTNTSLSYQYSTDIPVLLMFVYCVASFLEPPFTTGNTPLPPPTTIPPFTCKQSEHWENITNKVKWIEGGLYWRGEVNTVLGLTTNIFSKASCPANFWKSNFKL